MDGLGENNSTINFDDDGISAEDLQAHLSGEKPLTAAPPAQTGDEPPAEEETAADDATTGDEEEAASENEGEAEGDAEGDAPGGDEPGDLPAFEFTENADAETFDAELDQYLETVEVTPQIQHAFDVLRSRASQAEEKIVKYESLGDLQTVERSVGALNRIIEYKQNEQGEFVPDASGVIDLLNKDFPNERQHIIFELNAQPSAKYAGATVFQEFLRDAFGLNENSMATLQTFFDNGGELPVPRFTPPGIDDRFAEAYWKSLERDAIQTRVESAVWAIRSEDSTESEKAQAKQTLNIINQELQKAQAGLNAERKFKEETAAFAARQTEQIEQQANNSFVSTVNELSASLSGNVVKALGFVEGAGAEITADGIVALVSRAYSPEEWESKPAQARLAAKGIAHDWNKGRELLDRLYDNERKLAAQTADKHTNPRAVENTKREKANLLRELRKEELQIVGRITQAVAKDAGKTLAKKVKNAPKIQAVKPKIASTGDRAKPQKNWDDPSIKAEDIQGYLLGRSANPFAP